MDLLSEKTSVRARHGKKNNKKTDEPKGFIQPGVPFVETERDIAYKWKQKGASSDLQPRKDRAHEENVKRELNHMRSSAADRLNQLMVKMNRDLKDDDQKRQKIRQAISTHNSGVEKKAEKIESKMRAQFKHFKGTMKVESPVEGVTWKMFEHFACMVVAVYKTDDVLSRLAIFNLYMSAELRVTAGDMLYSHSETILQYATEMFKGISPDIFRRKFLVQLLSRTWDVNGFEPETSPSRWRATVGLTDLREMPMVKEATRLISSLFYMIVSNRFGTFSLETLQKIQNTAEILKTGNFLVDVLAWCSNLFDGMCLFIETGDWKDIFQANTLSRWAHDVDLACVAALEVANNSAAVEKRGEVIETLDAYTEESREKLLAYAPGSSTYIALQRLIEKIKGAKGVMQRSMISSRVRPSPFAVQIQGSVGIGKTYTAHKLMCEVMLAYGHTPREDLIWTINNEKYDSALTESKKVYFIDDISCVKQIPGLLPAHLKVITMCNFAAGFAEKAAVEDKGKIMYTPDAMVCTSNQLDMDADTYFNTPAAYLRRWKFVVTVVVDPVICTKRGNGHMVIDHQKLKYGESIDQYQYFSVMMRVPNGSDNTCDMISVDSSGFDFPEGGSVNYMGTRLFRLDEMIQVLRRYMDRHISMSNFVVSDIDKIYSEGVQRSQVVVKANPTLRLVLSTGPLLAYVVAWAWALYAHIIMYLSERWEGVKKAPSRLIDESLNLLEDRVAHKAQELRNRLQDYILPMLNSLKVIGGLAAAGFFIYMIKKVFDVGSFVGSGLYALAHRRRARLNPTIKFMMKGREIEKKDGYPEATKAPVMYPHTQKYKRAPVVPRPKGFGIPMGATSQMKFETKVKEQSVMLVYSHPSLGTNCAGNGLHVRSGYILTCWHNVALLNIPEPSIIKIMSSNESQFSWHREVAISASQMYRVPGKDLCYLYIPQLHDVFDLTPFMVCPGTMDVPLSAEAVIGSLEQDDSNDDLVSYKSKTITHLTPSDATYVAIGETYKSRLCVGRMTVPCIPGNSGSSCYQVMYERIIGVQVGVSDDGSECLVEYLSPLTKEIRDTINPRFRDREQFIPPPVELIAQTGKGSIAQHVAGSGCLLIGSIPNYEHHPTKSHFRLTKAAKFLATEEENGVVQTPDGKQFAFPILDRRMAKAVDEGEEDVYVDPHLVAVAKMAESAVEPHMELVDKAYEDFISPLEAIPGFQSGPLDMFQVLNGVDTINPINSKTSAGYPMKGKKSAYMEEYRELDGTTRKRLLPEIQVKYDKYKQDLWDGTQPMSLFEMHLKDEMISPNKAIDGRERAFMGGDMFLTMATREHLGPCMDFIAKHSDEFECKIGINVGGPAWKKIGDRLKGFKFLNAGDVRNFDKTHLRVVLLYFVDFMERIATKLGYTERQKRMVALLIYRQIYYYVIVKGDVFAFFRAFCSGSVITTHINSFCMSMYLRIAWYMYFETEFRKSNAVDTFGDDNIMGTNEARFDFFLIKSALAVWGIDYTPATKDDSEKAFLTFEELTFLKRRFVEDVLIGEDGELIPVTLCPIDESSLWKSLIFTDCKKEMEESILASQIIDVHMQFFMFGKVRFEVEKLKLQALAEQLGFVMPTEGHLRWRTFEEIQADFLSNQLQLNFT